MENTLPGIDFSRKPDETGLTRITGELLPWLTGILAAASDFVPIINVPAAQEDAVYSVVRGSIEEQLPNKIEEISKGYLHSVDEACMYAVALGLGLLSRSRLYADIPIRVLEGLQMSEPEALRTSAGLVRLALGVKGVELDVEALERCIAIGMLFQFPLDVYCRILEGLKPLAETTRTIPSKIHSHFDWRKLPFGGNSDRWFRGLETAIFLASTGIVSKPVLEVLMYLSEANHWAGVEEIYLERCRKVVVHLLETDPEARKTIADYIIEESKETPEGEVMGWMKTLQSIDPCRSDLDTLTTLLRIAENACHVSYSRETVLAVVHFVQEGPFQDEARRLLVSILGTKFEADDDLTLFEGAAQAASNVAQSDKEIANVLTRRARRDPNRRVREIARKAYEGRYG